MIIIPFEVPSQNVTEKGRNWRSRAASTKGRRLRWAAACRSEMARLGILPATGKRRLHVCAYRKRMCFDIGNLIGGFKACADGLVDAGLLVDDRDTKALITYEQQLASKSPDGRTCTILSIEDA